MYVGMICEFIAQPLATEQDHNVYVAAICIHHDEENNMLVCCDAGLKGGVWHLGVDEAAVIGVANPIFVRQAIEAFNARVPELYPEKVPEYGLRKIARKPGSEFETAVAFANETIQSVIAPSDAKTLAKQFLKLREGMLVALADNLIAWQIAKQGAEALAEGDASDPFLMEVSAFEAHAQRHLNDFAE